MVRELFITRNGNYANLWEGHQQPSMLGIIDARGWENNSQKKKDSVLAKKKAMAFARKKEKEGWQKVSIRAIYSYGYVNPFRYDIESWGGFK